MLRNLACVWLVIGGTAMLAFAALDFIEYTRFITWLLFGES